MNEKKKKKKKKETIKATTFCIGCELENLHL